MWHNPLAPVITPQQKTLIRNALHSKQFNNSTDIVITEQSNLDWKKKEILDFLIVDYITCCSKYEELEYKKISSTSVTSNIPAFVYLPINDLVDHEHKLYEANPLCSINSGLVRPTNTSRQSTSSSTRDFPFIFAMSLVNYERRVKELKKQPQRLEEMKEKLNNPNFRSYVEKAKQLYYMSTNPFNFYARYSKEHPYEEQINYQIDEEQDNNIY